MRCQRKLHEFWSEISYVASLQTVSASLQLLHYSPIYAKREIQLCGLLSCRLSKQNAWLISPFYTSHSTKTRLPKICLIQLRFILYICLRLCHVITLIHVIDNIVKTLIISVTLTAAGIIVNFMFKTEPVKLCFRYFLCKYAVNAKL